MHKHQLGKIICYGLGCYIGYYVLIWSLPYIELLLAVYGACYLWKEYERNKRNRQ